MVLYYGRARQRTGMVNRNQVGIKMQGLTSSVGRRHYLNNAIARRVNAMQGICGGAKMHGSMWRKRYKDSKPYCREMVSRTLGSSAGIGSRNIPYYR